MLFRSNESETDPCAPQSSSPVPVVACANNGVVDPSISVSPAASTPSETSQLAMRTPGPSIDLRGIGRERLIEPYIQADHCFQSAVASHVTMPDIDVDAARALGVEPRGEEKGSLIDIQVGTEAMQARANRLYFRLFSYMGMTNMDMRVSGPAIFLPANIQDSIREVCQACDETLLAAQKACLADGDVDLKQEETRAFDRARKTVERAFHDLLMVYAIDPTDEDNSGHTGYLLYRLPDVRRRQVENGVARVRKCTGGKRMLIDAEGRNVGRRSVPSLDTPATALNPAVSPDTASAVQPAA